MAITDRIELDDLDRWVSGDQLSILFAEHGMPMSAATIATKGRGRTPRGSSPLYRINNRRAEYHLGRALEWRRSLLEYRGSNPSEQQAS
jgi:hypothetical protein